MEGFILVVALAVLAAWGHRLFQKKWSVDEAILGTAATRLGLSRRWSLHRLTDDPKWQGTVDGLPVTLTRIGIMDCEVIVELAEASAVTPAALSLTRRTQFVGSTAGTKTGDESFDELVHAEGRPDLVSAALGQDARSMIHDLMASGNLKAVQGNTTWTVTIKPGCSSEFLYRCLSHLLLLAKTCGLRPSEIAPRLAANALNDPDAGVRLVSFERLAAFHPESKETSESAKILLGAQDPRLRLAAARSLDTPEALVVLRSLAGQEGIEEEVRKGALFDLAFRIPKSESLSILTGILENSESPAGLRLTAIRAAGRLGLTDLLPLLLKAVEHAHDEHLIALAEALGGIGGPAAEAALLQRLTVDNRVAQEAVLDALGSIATASAVDDLLELTRGIGNPGYVKDAARRAIARIQARLLGAARGQLSLSDAPEGTGTLSLTDDARGSLSTPSGSPSPPQTEFEG